MRYGSSNRTSRAFTLIEIMISMTLFALIIGAVYSSWTSILKGTRIGLDAAAEVQRKRVAMRVVEDSFKSAVLFSANAPYYTFIADNSDPDYTALSFVARLPQSFPRSGRYFEHPVRRVTFTVEQNKDGGQNLVLRQNPFMVPLDPEEEANPLVLAKNLRLFVCEYFNVRTEEWEQEWLNTNQLPQLVRVTLATSTQQRGQLHPEDVVTRVINIAATAIPEELQTGQQDNRQTRRTNARDLNNQEGQPLNTEGGDPNFQDGGLNRGDPRSLNQPGGLGGNRFQQGANRNQFQSRGR